MGILEAYSRTRGTVENGISRQCYIIVNGVLAQYADQIEVLENDADDILFNILECGVGYCYIPASVYVNRAFACI